MLRVGLEPTISRFRVEKQPFLRLKPHELEDLETRSEKHKPHALIQLGHRSGVFGRENNIVIIKLVDVSDRQRSCYLRT